MNMTDPLGDMLTRIRNGQAAKKDSVLTPASKLRASVLDVLQREGYIRGYQPVADAGPAATIRIELKYFEGQPAIRHLARVSKPGRRVYSGRRSCRASATAWASPSFRRRRVFCRTRKRARRTSAAKSSARCSDMSRIGKKSVAIPAGVQASIADGQLTVKGPKGQLAMALLDDISYSVEATEIKVLPANDSKRARAFWGCSARWCRTWWWV